MPAFRKQKTSVFNPASTSSQEQPVNRKQTTIQAPRSSSHRQRDEPHHHSIYTEIHDDVHPLSLPAFRKQSLSTADPASASSQERPVNYRRQKTPQPTTNSSQRKQNGPHWQSNHTEIQEGDNVINLLLIILLIKVDMTIKHYCLYIDQALLHKYN